MKSGLVSLLANEATINTLVGSRVYVGNAPQNAEYPYILLTQMDSDEMGSLDATTSNLRSVTFDIDCKALRSLTATTLGDAVRVFLDDYTGAAGSETIRAVVMNSENDGYEPPVDGSEIGTYVVTLDVDVFYNP